MELWSGGVGVTYRKYVTEGVSWVFWRLSFLDLSWSFFHPWHYITSQSALVWLSCMIFIILHYGFKSNKAKWPGVKILETIKLTKPFVLVRVTVAVMKHHDPSTLGRKGFIWFMLVTSEQESRGRNLEAGTDAEAMEKACFSCFTQSVFLQNLGWPVQVWHNPQWAGTSFINKELRECSTGLTIAWSYKEFSQIRVSHLI